METINKYGQLIELLNLDHEKYEKAANMFMQDKKAAVLEYLGFEDTEDEIPSFEIFIYYYISENMPCYFHNNNGKNFTRGMQKLVEGLDLNIDFDEFEKQEAYYPEILVDILQASLDAQLRKNNKKTVVGLNIGLLNSIYILTDYPTLKKIKDLELYSIVIFDLQYLEDIYGVIYQLKEDIVELKQYIEKGDYIMETPNNNGSYITLFDATTKKTVVINSLTPEQKAKLRVVL